MTLGKRERPADKAHRLHREYRTRIFDGAGGAVLAVFLDELLEAVREAERELVIDLYL